VIALRYTHVIMRAKPVVPIKLGFTEFTLSSMLRFFASLRMTEGERFAMTVLCCYKERSGYMERRVPDNKVNSIQGRG